MDPSTLSNELVAYATANQKYVLIKEGNNRFTDISQAYNLWMNDPTLIFIPSYRLAGKKEDIMKALNIASFPELPIITFENYNNTMAQTYSADLTNYNNWKRAMVNRQNGSYGIRMMDILVKINPSLISGVKNVKNLKEMGVSVAVKPRNRVNKGLEVRLRALEAGKILDVSNLEIDGTGARAMVMPKTRTTKFMYPSLPMASNNIDKYVLALSMLPGGLQYYMDEINAAKQFFGVDVDISAYNIAEMTSEPVEEKVNIIESGFAPPNIQYNAPTKTYPMFTKRQRENLEAMKKIEEAKSAQFAKLAQISNAANTANTANTANQGYMYEPAAYAYATQQVSNNPYNIDPAAYSAYVGYAQNPDDPNAYALYAAYANAGAYGPIPQSDNNVNTQYNTLAEDQNAKYVTVDNEKALESSAVPVASNINLEAVSSQVEEKNAYIPVPQ